MIEDTTNPTIDVAASDLTVECDGAGNQTELLNWLNTQGGATTSDHCGSISWTNDFMLMQQECGATGISQGYLSSNETHSYIEFRATDDCGNFLDTSATFIIEDTTPPQIDFCPDNLTLECDGTGNITEVSNWLNSFSASDVCGSVYDYANLSDECGVSGNILVTFTATDDCANVTSCTATLTIEDTSDPTIVVEASDLTVECDGFGNNTDLTNWLMSVGGASASDNCGSISWTNDFTALSDDCGATGSIQITFTATDDCDNWIYSNVSTTVAVFTIEDTTPPSIDFCPADLVIECDGAGNTTEINKRVIFVERLNFQMITFLQLIAIRLTEPW